MAILTGYYNSISGDRKYNAEDMSKYFNGIISRGVLQNYKDKFAVRANTGMNIIIPSGKAYFGDGKYIENTTDYPVTLDASDVVLNRIDRIVLRNNRSVGVRNGSIVVKKGVPAANPVAPTVENTETMEELSLATIRINKLTENITQSNITNTIPDNSVCGYVTGLIEQVDTSDLYSQYEAAYSEFKEQSEKEFNEWFEQVQGTLGTIGILRSYSNVVTTTQANQYIIPINISEYNYTLDVLEVYINGFKLTDDMYINNNTNIELALPLAKDQEVEIVVYKTVDPPETKIA